MIRLLIALTCLMALLVGAVLLLEKAKRITINWSPDQAQEPSHGR